MKKYYLASISIFIFAGIVILNIHVNANSTPPESIESLKLKLNDSISSNRNSEDSIEVASNINSIDDAAKSKIQIKQQQLIYDEPELRKLLENKSHEERLKIIKEEQEEVNQWETQNNVPTGYLIVLNPFN